MDAVADRPNPSLRELVGLTFAGAVEKIRADPNGFSIRHFDSVDGDGVHETHFCICFADSLSEPEKLQYPELDDADVLAAITIMNVQEMALIIEFGTYCENPQVMQDVCGNMRKYGTGPEKFINVRQRLKIFGTMIRVEEIED